MSVTVIHQPVNFYLDKVDKHEAFSFARYWDGELACIVGRTGKNCDGCSYLPELKEALIKTITNNYDYYHALYFPEFHVGTSGLRSSFENFLRNIGSKVEWYDFMIWQSLVETGNFSLVLNSLRKRNVIFVGGRHLYKVTNVFPIRKFINIPIVDSFTEVREIKAKIKISCHDTEDPVVVLCAGMASNVIINDLFPELGNKVTMLDMGSVWDAVIGLESRQWIRRIPKDVLTRNLTGG